MKGAEQIQSRQVLGPPQVGEKAPWGDIVEE